MKLLKFKCSDIEADFTMPKFQRSQDNRVNKIATYMKEAGEYASMPIVANERFEIIDGGHRVKAFVFAVKNYNIKDEILVLIDSNANKETFVRLNKTKQVSFSHKAKIHDAIIYLENNMGASFTVGSSTKSSLGSADFARGLYMIRGNISRIKQCSQDEAFYLLDNIGTEKLRESYLYINEIKNRYIDNVGHGKKFLQKLFLYFCYLNNKIELKDKDIHRVSSRFPRSLGGDIGIAYNKELFVEAYNYNKKAGRVDISIFNNNREV